MQFLSRWYQWISHLLIMLFRNFQLKHCPLVNDATAVTVATIKALGVRFYPASMSMSIEYIPRLKWWRGSFIWVYSLFSSFIGFFFYLYIFVSPQLTCVTRCVYDDRITSQFVRVLIKKNTLHARKSKKRDWHVRKNTYIRAQARTIIIIYI